MNDSFIWIHIAGIALVVGVLAFRLGMERGRRKERAAKVPTIQVLPPPIHISFDENLVRAWLTGNKLRVMHDDVYQSVMARKEK